MKKFFYKPGIPFFLIPVIALLPQLDVRAADEVADSLSIAPEAMTAVAGNGTGFKLTVDSTLTITALILLVVIAILAFTLKTAIMMYYKKNVAKKPSLKAGEKNDTGGGVVPNGVWWMMPLLAVSPGVELAGTAVQEVNYFRYLVSLAILLELTVIWALTRWIRLFTGIKDMLDEERAASHGPNFGAFWAKFNKFKPLSEERSIMLEHNYDGITELDNATPPWFTIAFTATIILGIVYIWRYNVAEAAPTQEEEYEIAVTKAQMKIDAYLKSQSNLVDENTVTLLTDASDVEAGKKVFAGNCTACHGNAGEGGVGPNLTDDYWLHGGGVKNIFKTIKYGVPDKGMMSWRNNLSPSQIQQVSSYIISIHNSHPAGAKEPQGELYNEEMATGQADSTSSADTAGVLTNQ